MRVALRAVWSAMLVLGSASVYSAWLTKAVHGLRIIHEQDGEASVCVDYS